MDGDALAGIVALFGGLTRAELSTAVREHAGRHGDGTEHPDDAIDAAQDAYELLAVAHDGTTVLVPGPIAFPEPPAGAEDLPHILADTERRTVPAAARADAVRQRLTAAAADADPGSEHARRLVDVTYDAEAWVAVDLSGVRNTLTDHTGGPSEDA